MMDSPSVCSSEVFISHNLVTNFHQSVVYICCNSFLYVRILALGKSPGSWGWSCPCAQPMKHYVMKTYWRKSPWYPFDRRLRGPQNRAWRRGEGKNLTPTGTQTRSLGRPARSQSLYRLRYPASRRARMKFICIYLITDWMEKLIVTELLNKFPAFLDPRNVLPCLQDPAHVPILSQMNRDLNFTSVLSNLILNSHQCPTKNFAWIPLLSHAC
jgi:hypothetical protein